ncbi:MAG: FAD-dependent oxidoreductase [Pseudomonadota bacterium]
MTGAVAATPVDGFDVSVPIVVIGAGAAGLVAALAAQSSGSEVLVVEADAQPSGSTALSAGLIPAAGTRLQAAEGIEDTPDLFARDIQSKAHGENDPALVQRLVEAIPGTLDWLATRHGLPFSVVTDFDYPGHSRRRMHGLPTRSGRDLIDGLRAAAGACEIDIVCDRRAVTVFSEDKRITGVEVLGPSGRERIECGALVLACNGFGGNRAMVEEYMPQIVDAVWFGHDGNRGDAIVWGNAIGADTRHLGAYQGHGNVAYPHGILITWATITEGGVQVNANGRRFWDESQGYSEAARAVLAQPGGVAWTIFDARIAGVARQFQDFKDAEAAGAIRSADSVSRLARVCGLPEETLAETFDSIPWDGSDAFGRAFGPRPITPPFHAVKVTGALFHTQGGLCIDRDARVRLAGGGVLPNLYAAGGAAVGVSGSGDSGYLSGNGLLSAVALGAIAGKAAAKTVAAL